MLASHNVTIRIYRNILSSGFTGVLLRKVIIIILITNYYWHPDPPQPILQIFAFWWWSVLSSTLLRKSSTTLPSSYCLSNFQSNFFYICSCSIIFYELSPWEMWFYYHGDAIIFSWLLNNQADKIRHRLWMICSFQ